MLLGGGNAPWRPRRRTVLQESERIASRLSCVKWVFVALAPLYRGGAAGAAPADRSRPVGEAIGEHMAGDEADAVRIQGAVLVSELREGAGARDDEPSRQGGSRGDG